MDVSSYDPTAQMNDAQHARPLADEIGVVGVLTAMFKDLDESTAAIALQRVLSTLARQHDRTGQVVSLASRGVFPHPDPSEV